MADVNDRLVVELVANVDKLEAGLRKAGVLTAGFSETVGKHANTIEGAFRRIGNVDVEKALSRTFDRSRLAIIEDAGAKIPIFGSAIEALGGAGLAAAGGIAALAAAFESAKKAADWAEDLERTSKAIGISTGALQQLDFIAQATGVPVQQMRQSLQGLSETIGRVQDNLVRGKQGAQVKVFELIFGEDAEKTKKDLRDAGGNLDAILPKITAVAAKLPATERAGFAQALRIDPQVLNALVDRAKAVDDAKRAFHEYGLEVDESVIKRSAAAAEQMHIVSAVMQDELREAMLQLAPAAAKAELGLLGVFNRILDIIRGASVALAPIGELIDKLQHIPGVPKLSGGLLSTLVPGLPLLNVLGQMGASDRLVAQEKALGAGTGEYAKPDATQDKIDPRIEKLIEQLGQTPKKGGAARDATAADEAERGYLEAQIKGARDLETLHQLRLQLIALEYADAVDKAKTEKGITPATRSKLITTAGLTRDAAIADENQTYGRQVADHARSFSDQLTKLRDDQLRSESEITGSLAARQQAETDELANKQAAEREDLARKLADDKATTAGEAAQLKTAQAQAQAAETAALAAKQAIERANQQDDAALELLQDQDRELKAKKQIAKTAEDRQALDRQLLAVEQQIAQLEFDKKARTEHLTPDQVAAGQSALGAEFAAQSAQVAQQDRGPIGDALAKIPQTGDQVQQALGVTAVQGVHSLEDALVGLASRTETPAQAFKRMVNSIIADLLRLVIQMSIERALLQAFGLALGGVGGGSIVGAGQTYSGVFGSLSSGFASSITGNAIGTPDFGGGLTWVGESGRELVNLPRGSQVFSNSQLSNLARGVGGQPSRSGDVNLGGVHVYAAGALNEAAIRGMVAEGVQVGMQQATTVAMSQARANQGRWSLQDRRLRS